MSKLLVIGGVNFGGGAPVVPIYDRIESAGSLFLYDPSQARGAFDGVPAFNQVIPNVLSNRASLLLGVDENDTRALVNNTLNAYLSVERSTKGGIHVISSQNPLQPQTTYYGFRMSDAVRNYVASHPTHSFYFSLWSKITRPGIANSAEQSNFDYAINTSNYLFYLDGGIFRPTANSTNSPTVKNSAVTPGTNRFSAGAAASVTGSMPSPPNIIAYGGNRGAWSGFNAGKAPSLILYRCYIEDMTVSGRTFADVAALDKSLFDAAFAAGGKFYGDSYSDPVTVLP